MQRFFRITTSLLFVFLTAVAGFAAEDGTVFSTWDTFEADKCASIWLIKRFIAPEAEIRFYKHGQKIEEGIEFDTPSAKFRRYATKSTYETLLAHYALDDPGLQYIGRIIHDIEINVWEKKAMKESPIVAEAIQKIISGNKGNLNDMAEAGNRYFDKIFQARKKN